MGAGVLSLSEATERFQAGERHDLNSVSKQVLCGSCGCEGPDSMVTWTRVVVVGMEKWMG